MTNDTKTFQEYSETPITVSGPPIKQTPSIKRTLSRVPKLTSYISFIANLYSADTKINRIWLISIVKNLRSEHGTEMTIVVLDYLLEIRTVVDL